MSTHASVNPAPSLPIVDFHSHFVGPSFTLTTLAGVPQGQRAFWEGVNRLLSDPAALISSIESSGIAARVINTPLEFLEDPDGNVPPGTTARINDALAELASRHPGRLYGLATVDAYAGDAGAKELVRAVRDLGLRGVFVASAKGSLLPDAKEARPTFAAAAALGVPVFMHPVADAQMESRFRRFGRLGARLTRSTINSAALFATMESGMFEELPNLRVVVTALAFGGVVLAAGTADGSRIRKDTPPIHRRHVYIDTTGLDPVALRGAVDILGADHVLTGTDWPVVQEKSLPERLQAILGACGLDAEQQRMVTSRNALRLLGVPL